MKTRQKLLRSLRGNIRVMQDEAMPAVPLLPSAAEKAMAPTRILVRASTKPPEEAEKSLLRPASSPGDTEKSLLLRAGESYSNQDEASQR